VGIFTSLLGIGKLLPAWVWLVAGVALWGAWHKHRAAKADELKREVAALEQRAAAVDRVNAAGDLAVVAARARAGHVRAAAVAGDGLRLRAAAAAASAAGSCQEAADTSGVLAVVLGSVEAAGRRMAEIADEHIAAVAACERAFDAVTATSTERTPR
jgi:hypothetical protein